jgi:hypothetical protein
MTDLHQCEDRTAAGMGTGSDGSRNVWSTSPNPESGFGPKP